MASRVSRTATDGGNEQSKSSKGEPFVTLTCPNCGNDRNFQVKTLQMHVVHLEDGRVEVSDEDRPTLRRGRLDRKSTRLNSSHITISYAVFCLKKKKKKKKQTKKY